VKPDTPVESGWVLPSVNACDTYCIFTLSTSCVSTLLPSCSCLLPFSPPCHTAPPFDTAPQGAYLQDCAAAIGLTSHPN
jgi:hypothetical protein